MPLTSTSARSAPRRRAPATSDGSSAAGREMPREVADVLGLALGQSAAGSVGSRWRRARVGRPGAADRGGATPRAAAVAPAPVVATTTRSQIVCAALTEICWPTIARASVVNGVAAAREVKPGMAADDPRPGSGRRGRGRGRRRPTTAASRRPASRVAQRAQPRAPAPRPDDVRAPAEPDHDPAERGQRDREQHDARAPAACRARPSSRAAAGARSRARRTAAASSTDACAAPGDRNSGPYS